VSAAALCVIRFFPRKEGNPDIIVNHDIKKGLPAATAATTLYATSNDHVYSNKTLYYTWSFPAVICLKPKQSNGDGKIQPEPHKTRPKSRLGLPIRRYRTRMDRIGSGRVFGIGGLGSRTMTCAHKRRKINVEQPAAVDLEYAIDARWRDDGPPRQTRCQGTR